MKELHCPTSSLMAWRLVCVALGAAWGGTCWAGGAAQAVATTAAASVASSASVAGSGLVITNFSVPIGVPVATLSAPAAWFAYGSPQPAPVAEAPVAEAARDEPRCRCAGCACAAPGARVEALADGELVDEEAEPPPGLTVLRRRCATCHRGAEAQGGLKLFDESGAPAGDLHERAAALLGEVLARRMPKGGQLSAEEKVQLFEYLMQKGE